MKSDYDVILWFRDGQFVIAISKIGQKGVINSHFHDFNRNPRISEYCMHTVCGIHLYDFLGRAAKSAIFY